MATSRATVVPMKMAQRKAAQVPKPGADFEIVERGIRLSEQRRSEQ
jgi:hypothetical protein